MKIIRFLSLFVITTLLTVLLVHPGLAQEEVICESDVIVQDGDWLSTIAEQAYGDPTLYDVIALATNLKAETDPSYAAIGSYDVVEPGWKLCIPSQQQIEELEVIAPADPAVLTVDELINATYSGIYEEPIALTEGLYEGEPFDEGGASRPIVQYMNNSEIYGDLNGDGVDDAAVFLVESGGGSGNFVYVAAQLNQNGQPVDAGAVWIEDRVQIISADIENGQINLEITAEGPGDAACCKTHKTSVSYALQDGLLVQLPGEQSMEKISADNLNGTIWTLLEISEDQPVLADTPITISFEDGQITGFAGCNNYSTSFTLDSDNPFLMTIAPVISTQMACDEAILDQEIAYLTALNNSDMWGYDVGRLAFAYTDEQGNFKRMLFEPVVEEAETSNVDMLTANTWQWVSFTDPVQQFDVDQPENYTITFNPDDTVNIKADCKEPGGTYAADESGTLTISVDPVIMMICSEESRSDEFIANLGFAAGYFFQDDTLYIDMMADGGTLKFSPQAATEMATSDEMAASTSFTYQCDADKSFTAEFTDGSVNLAFDDGQMMTLPQVPAASGAKYSDDLVTFWTQGDEGFVEANGEKTYQNCVATAN